MRIGFVTCVQLGRGCIEEVHSIGGNFSYFGTLCDDLAVRKSGRVYLHDLAERSRTPLHQFRHINDPDTVAALRDADLDWLFIVGWSQIAGPDVLASTRRGVLGMHPTLLPEGRGRASVPWAILRGLERTGVTLFQLDEGVDTGPILDQVEIPIRADETATTLYDKVVEGHRGLIREVWPRLQSGSIVPRPQDESRATEWPGRTAADGELTERLSVMQADRLVRATTHPYPGAFLDRPTDRLRVWSAHVRSAACTHPGDILPFSDGTLCALETSVESRP
jgi:methionyl-tRNA formyltransferase